MYVGDKCLKKRALDFECDISLRRSISKLDANWGNLLNLRNNQFIFINKRQGVLMFAIRSKLKLISLVEILKGKQ